VAQPKNSQVDRTGKRTYTWAGEQFTSVTTLLQALSKPALVNWAAKMVAEYAVDHIDEISALAKADAPGAVRALKGSPWQKRDDAAALGTTVHDHIEAHVLDQTPPTPSPEVGVRMAYFENWLTDYNPVFEASEATVYNRKHGYAGTLDAIAIIGENRYIIDVKTTKSGVFPEHSLQLTAYRHAEFIGAPNGDEVPMPEVDGAAVLWLSPTGYKFVGVRSDADIFESFLAIRSAWQFQNVIGKSAILDQIEVPR